MPQYRITDPETGRQIVITGDNPPTGDQIRKIMSTVRQSSASGEAPSEDAPNPAMRTQTREPIDVQDFREKAIDELAQEGGLFDDFTTSAALGLRNIGRGLGLVDSSGRDAELMLAESLKEKSPITSTIGEVVGESAPFALLGAGAGSVPLLAGNVVSRLVTAGALGAIEGGVSAKGRGGDVLQSAATTGGLAAVTEGVLEAVLPRITRIAGPLIRKVTGRAPKHPPINPDGSASAELQDALESSGLTVEDLTESAVKIVEKESGKKVDEVIRERFLREQGLEPTQAQITRDATTFEAQQEAAKASSLVRDRLEEQQATLSQNFENKLNTAGIDKDSSAISDLILEKALAADKNVSNLYRQARELTAGDKGSVRPVKLASELKRLRADDPLVNTVKTRLVDAGVIDAKFNVRGRMNVDQAERARQLLNEFFDPVSGGRTNMVIKELKSAIDQDVFRGAGADFFEEARKSKMEFERSLDTPRLNKLDKSNKNIVRDIAESRIRPDQVFDKLVLSKTTGPRDVKAVKEYLGDSETGKKAFEGLRADTIDYIRDKAFTGPVDAKGYRALNVRGLASALSTIKKPKLDVILTKDEQQFLRQLKKTGDLLQPVRGTGIGRGPSARAIEGSITKLMNMLSRIPGVGTSLDLVAPAAGAFSGARKAKVIRGKATSKPIPAEEIRERFAESVGTASSITEEREED